MWDFPFRREETGVWHVAQGTLLQVPEGLLPGTSSFLLLVREGSDSSSEPLPPRAPEEPSGYCPRAS